MKKNISIKRIKIKKIIGDEIKNICENQVNPEKHPGYDQILKSMELMKP